MQCTSKSSFLTLQSWGHGPSDHPGVRLWPLQTRFDGPRESFQKFLPGNAHRIHPPFQKSQPGDTTHLCILGSWGWMKFWICFIRIALKKSVSQYHQGSLPKVVYDGLHKSPNHRVHVCIALPTCTAKEKGPAETAVWKGSENKLFDCVKRHYLICVKKTFSFKCCVKIVWICLVYSESLLVSKLLGETFIGSKDVKRFSAQMTFGAQGFSGWRAGRCKSSYDSGTKIFWCKRFLV